MEIYEEFHKDVVEFLRKWSLREMVCSSVKNNCHYGYSFSLDEAKGKLHINEYYNKQLVEMYEERVK